MNDKMDGNYGVPRDLFTQVKLVGFFLRDIVTVLGSGFLGFILATKIFPPDQWIQMIVFILLSPIIALYLVLPTNGGKQNWHSLLLEIKRRKKFWISFDYDKEQSSKELGDNKMILQLKKKSNKAEDQLFEDVNSWIDESPIKRIMNNKGEYIELAEGGFLQFMEITGKDIYSLGNAEVDRTLQNYYDWLTKFTPDWTVYTTTLPTNTDRQIAYLKQCLAECRKAIKDCRIERKYRQLLDREARLLSNIRVQEAIKKKIYNVEFILFLYSDTVKEMDEIVRKAMSYGNGDFVPKEITREKKETILTQYFNMNDKV